MRSPPLDPRPAHLGAAATAALAIAALATAALGCGGSHRAAAHPQPASLASAPAVSAHLSALRARRGSFTAESVMDYWLGKDRVKGTVLVMGTAQRQLRLNALSPQGGGVLADLACNGADFAYVDFQSNCQLSGPCTRASIAALLRVELEPEDFHALALGVVPVDSGATGTVAWDAATGQERVTLQSAAGTQTLVIDAREGRFDVLASELVGPDGKVAWSVENADFAEAADATGAVHRLPRRTRFRSPAQSADLLVEWRARTLNVAIDPAKFTVAVPAGLARCGAAPATAAGP
jgi:hypothetical protein